jgi:regulator of sigma E protease
MEIFLIRVLQFMLAISILVLLHEGGHFFFARLFGVRVEKFYLFFDPWFHLFEFKPKKSDTTYGVGWLPLGGYCKISGMIDESFDTDQMAQPEQPWEFRSKPAWQRLLIMIGGVLVNFLLALFIYSMILFYWGDSYIPVKNMTYGMKFNTEAKALGFQDGDVLIGTEKGEFKDFSADLYRSISSATRVDILRGGRPMSLALPGDLNLLDMMKNQPPFVRPLHPANVTAVQPKSEAERIGMRKGDKIIAVGKQEIGSFNEYMEEIDKRSDMLAVAETHKDSMLARRITISWLRAGGDTITKAAQLSADLKLGFSTAVSEGLYKPVTTQYGFLESFPAGAKYGVHVLASYVDDMKYVFTADGAKSLGGFGAIGSLFPPTWDWYMFWKMTAFLSIILAFMNILPIPALDGGHVLFLVYEIVTRRKPSEGFMIKAEYLGFGILILLMVVANMNDILRWLGYL